MTYKIVTCAGTRTSEDFSFELFKHWVRHYLGYGFAPKDWLISLFAASPDDNICEVVGWLRQQGIEVQRCFMDSPQHIPHLQEAEYLRLRATLTPDDWVVILDADEFIEYPDSAPVFFHELEWGGYDMVRGYLVDRVAADFSLRKVTADNLFDQFPIKTSISRNVARACVSKVCGFRNRFSTPLGHHWLKGDAGRWPRDLQVHHFKWTYGLHKRMLRTLELPPEKIFWRHEIERMLPWVTEDKLLISVSSPQAQLVPSA